MKARLSGHFSVFDPVDENLTAEAAHWIGAAFF